MKYCPTCHQPLPQSGQPTKLTAREMDVLKHLARGYRNKEIVVELGMNAQTLKNHISHILTKLHVQNRTAAVVCALRNRWIAFPEEMHEISHH